MSAESKEKSEELMIQQLTENDRFLSGETKINSRNIRENIMPEYYFSDRVSDSTINYLDENDRHEVSGNIVDELIKWSQKEAELDISNLSEDEKKDYLNDPKQYLDNYLQNREKGIKYVNEGIHSTPWGKDKDDTPHQEVLPIGKIISRAGDESGTYFGDDNIDFVDRQIDTFAPIHRYEVIKELPVTQSTVAQQKWAPERNNTSTQQYQTEKPVSELLDEYLREIPFQDLSNNEEDSEYEVPETLDVEEHEQPETERFETPETPESSREDGYMSDLDIDSDESDNADKIEDKYFREDAYMEESTDIGGKDIM